MVLKDLTKDIFTMFVLKDRTVAAGTGSGWMDTCSTTGEGYGFGCAAKVLKNEDY